MPLLRAKEIARKLVSNSAQSTADVPGLFDKPHLRNAAVLILLKPRSDGLMIVLTKRAATMRHHAGQVAFPGGAQEPTDKTPAHCAFREAEEEIGFSPTSGQVLGTLAPHLTISDFRVTPVVFWDESGLRYTPTSSEVDITFEVPAHHLLNLENFQTQERLYYGTKRQYLAIPYGPFYVWGATARMLQSLAMALKDD